MARISPLMILPPALFAGLAAIFLWGMGREDPNAIPTSFAGKPAPAVQIEPLGDTPVFTDADLRDGKVKIVNFWASWCGPCRQEMPTLAVAQQRDTGVGVLFVNQGESEATIRSYLSSARLSLNDVWLDRGSLLGKAVGSRGLPTTLFYDGQGKLVDAHFGVLNAAALEARIDALRASR